MQGQTHDAGKTAHESLDEHGTNSLDGIGASLAAGLAGQPIRGYFVGGDGSKANGADAQRGPMVPVLSQRYRTKYGVLTAREPAQHFGRMQLISRLAENPPIKDHLGVRPSTASGISSGDCTAWDFTAAIRCT